ncbi:MAG: mannose-6-phosphate isomerase, class I [Chitinophagaceae bacterium]|nr:MAG: mannose-6-phosphate isomerase, class I [Chitinophagaceae bacterium]
MAGIGKLTGTVKHYDWGGTRFIPKLMGEKKEASTPEAEFWLGVHPQADCKVTGAGADAVLLRDYIAADPAARLGSEVNADFGNIPYLLKALDVKDMLSIQVHPNKKAAVIDFEREEASGIALSDPRRNYKDRNHKPELMVAMGEFWLLHGFKPEEKLAATLASVKELNFLAPVFASGSYQGVYEFVMKMPQEEVSSRLRPLLDRIIPLYKEGKLDKSSEDFWAARAALTFSETDRGIFSIYLFNVVRTEKGQAVFQDAGIPHAYLEGWNVEIMASSDNVLRGGLTNKHVDVEELLKHVVCKPTHPELLSGVRNGKEIVYKTPAPDFELSGFELEPGDSVLVSPKTAEIFLLIDGEVSLVAGDDKVDLHAGAPSGIIFPGQDVKIQATAKSLLYKASVPA